MELSERKKKILQAIIDDYIVTAEPVGSSYILGSHNLGISSATVRNEMAALERLGYLEKPHTSAGRVPSDLGYRVYVNELMNEYKLTLKEIDQIKLALEKKFIEFNKIIANISDVTSLLTNYTTVFTMPSAQVYTISNIKLMSIDAVGEKFDPTMHNAVMHIDDDNYGENTVAQQFQKGYKYKDKVIRYSMVQVAN